MSSTQPSNVSTQDTPRPPDDSVVTDENQTWQAEQQAASAAPAAAGQSDKDGAGSKDDAAAASDPNQNEPTKKRDRASERRIKKLTKRLSAAEQREQERLRRINELEQENERLRTSQAAAPEPKLDDFKNPKEYAEAYAEWKAKQAPSGKKPDASSSTRQPATTGRQPGNAEAGGSKARAPEAELVKFQQRGTERLGDEFVEALTDQHSDLPVNQVMGDFMLESDVGPDIYVYLYNHTDEAREIFDKSPLVATKRLEALAEKAKAGKLLDADEDAGAGGESGQAAADAQAAADKTGQAASSGKRGSAPGNTRAPKPPDSGDDRGTAVVQKNPEDMSMDEYAEWRRKREQRH